LRALTAALIILGVGTQCAIPAGAGTIAIAEGENSTIVVTADNATVDEMLDALGQRFGFTVERVAPELNRKVFSGRFVGEPERLIDQMLRGVSHILVQSEDALVGIERVLLVGSSEPTAPLAPAPPPALLPDPSSPVTFGKPSPQGSYATGGQDQARPAGTHDPTDGSTPAKQPAP
jgi:hypothetical protein